MVSPSELEPSFVIDVDDDEDDGPAAVQPRAAETKAAKALRAADLSAARESEATRAALSRMTSVPEYRAEIAFWGCPDVRRTQ